MLRPPRASLRTLVLFQILLPEMVIQENTHWPHVYSEPRQRRHIQVKKHASQAFDAATFLLKPSKSRRHAADGDLRVCKIFGINPALNVITLRRGQHSTARHYCSSGVSIMAQLSSLQDAHQALGQCRNACRPFQAAKRFGRTFRSTITQASSQNEMSRRDAVLAAGLSH